MSSYYTAAQLEAMRKERIRKELAESIRRLSEQMQEKHENTVQITSSGNVELSVFASEEMITGVGGTLSVAKENMIRNADAAASERESLDFSGLLIHRQKNTRLETELNMWISRVDERPVLSRADEEARQRVVQQLQKILSQETDIEDKIRSVKMRITSYLQGKTVLTDTEKESIRAKYFEYTALCQLLDMTPVEHLPYRVEQEIKRMTAVIEKRKQSEYIMQVIESVMDKLGCHVKEDAILDHTPGQVFYVENHPLCDIFVGNDGSGIMFEPIGQSQGGSLEKKRQTAASVSHVCSLYSELEQQAAEMGVILTRVYLDPVNVDTMCMQSDIAFEKREKKQRKASAQKLKAMETGE